MRRVFIAIAACSTLIGSPARGASPIEELIAAAQADNVERIDALLSTDTELVRASDPRGRSALHSAADALSVRAALRLIEAGADVNARDRDGASPLHRTALATTPADGAAARRDEMARLLISKGADIAATDRQAMTPLHVAALKGRDEMLPLLAGVGRDVEDRLGRTPLHYATMGDHKVAINWLIDRAANVNARDHEGNTPLHLAALRFRRNATKLLLDRGADVNAANKRGLTPLHIAAGAGPPAPEVEELLIAVVRELMDAGGDASLKDNAGRTARREALDKDRLRLARMLE